MRFARTLTPKSVGASVDVTAMIDVVFLLIVFFMVTATVAQRWPEDVLLPEEVGQSAAVDMHEYVLHVDAAGAIRVGEQSDPVSLVSLGSMLGACSPDTRVLVRADHRCRSQQLDLVLDVLRDAGVQQIDFGVVTGR